MTIGGVENRKAIRMFANKQRALLYSPERTPASKRCNDAGVQLASSVTTHVIWYEGSPAFRTYSHGLN